MRNIFREIESEFITARAILKTGLEIGVEKILGKSQATFRMDNGVGLEIANSLISFRDKKMRWTFLLTQSSLTSFFR